ncbi:MAG TPA: hypothetical protein DDW90_08590 [Cyanobacteria bacterium UBA9971]|nr:hypothetical protein [Cyanobacteria bacterium UBA9971]
MNAKEKENEPKADCRQRLKGGLCPSAMPFIADKQAERKTISQRVDTVRGKAPEPPYYHSQRQTEM